ncbi:MAG TPA: DUF1549 and DUF1553 domain-containing protein [Bryobacteraceae bacterium]|nr:DUF1549 and DUF1553 domain-containing protein [Bryobacteraceae bacterium]
MGDPFYYKEVGHGIKAGLVLGLLVLPVAGFFVTTGEKYSAAERRHWSFRPRAPVAQGNIDGFILQKLKEQGLSPAPPASRTTLIRRVYLDVTGLPPSPGDVKRFVADKSGNAYESLVDRLLASPEYAERQAQQWLDVVRFAESDGFEYDTHRTEAWQYRDYVIRSFAEDKPYDRFVQEQLAGDEIAPNNPEMLVAASFNRLGPFRKNAGNQDAAYIRNEMLTEMTNVVGAAFLGVTLGCARCHDHKFDPIRHTDYYRMQAFFATTQHKDIPLANEAEQAAWKQKSDAASKELTALREKLKAATGPEKARIERVVGEKEKNVPEPLPALKTVLSDSKQYVPVHVLDRGSSDAPGEKMGMRPLGVLLPDGSGELGDAIDKPRVALAKWITDSANPLTARVMVNRIWQSHFGAGIVATPNDFGRMGTRPSHPELLDWLANQFVEGGFRMKPIHRMILLSKTYQQAYVPEPSAKALELDPQNKLLWRFSRRRLQAEELRDAMMVASGLYNSKRFGPSVIVPIELELVNLLYKPGQWVVDPDPAEHNRRSIYLFHKRNLRVPFMEVFDAPDTLLSCARRESSTHAPQALELLNGSVTRQASVALADRLKREAGPSTGRQIDLAFDLVFGRKPNVKEREASLRFLKKNPAREFALALFAANDFLYVQ